MKTLVAILIGKTISFLTKLFKIGGGSAAPGLYGLKIEPELVGKLSQKIPKNIVITGTNGKTTTAKMIAHFAKEAGVKVIRNHTGSNLERGIASSLIHNSNLKADLGIWELDEAAFNLVTPKLKPQIIIFLNVFRDQLDRYGEVDNVVKRWCQSLKSLSQKSLILVNGDDINTAKLAECFKGKVLTFGVKDYKLIGESLEKKKTSKKLDYEAVNVNLGNLKKSSFELNNKDIKLKINLPLPGIYHIYDALAAISCALNLQITPKDITSSLKTYTPAFGRVEKIDFGYIFLIKNPAGATQVFETISPHIKKDDRLLLALNDNLADGTDVSWIWDANFELLSLVTSHLSLICSGTRAYDLANRLKYAEFDPKKIKVEPELKKALRGAKMGLKGHLYILPTYTAMLELQSILAKSGIKKNYWEEQ